MGIKQNISLSKYSSYKIGGPAKFFAEVSSKEELIEVLRWWVTRLEHLPGGEAGKIFILGGGTNVLFNDKGFNGLVVHNKIKFIERVRVRKSPTFVKTSAGTQRVKESERVRVSVGSGVLIEDLLNYCIENSLSGLEWAGGLPGTVGGAIRGNAGAFGGEIKDIIVEIVSIVNIADREGNFEINTRNKRDCRFGYRNSIFKTNPNEIIIEAVLDFKKGKKDEITRLINEKIEYRKTKHPLEYPNIGSIFKNISTQDLPQNVREEFKDKIKTDPFPVLPSVKLIAGAGLTGKRVGDIMVSPKHPNFLVNIGDGKSKDVLSLIKIIKKKVFQKYKVELEEEISYLH